VGVVAAGVPRGLVEAVAAKGLEALDPKASSELVRDPKRFVEAVAAPGFKRYSDLVVGDLHERLGGGSGGGGGAATSTPTLANFFASRILVDEAVVSAAAAALATRAGSAMGTPAAPLLVLLAPVDRVKFGFGCQARLERALAPPVEEQSAPAPAPMVRRRSLRLPCCRPSRRPEAQGRVDAAPSLLARRRRFGASSSTPPSMSRCLHRGECPCAEPLGFMR